MTTTVRTLQRLALALSVLAMAEGFGAVRSARSADAEVPRPLTVDGIRRWHGEGGLELRPGDVALERAFDLDGDGAPERLLAVGRSGDRLVFALFRGGRLLSERIECVPPLIDATTGAVGGWRDLVCFEQSGSGRYRVRSYGWDGSGFSERAVRVQTSGDAPDELRIAAAAKAKEASAPAEVNKEKQGAAEDASTPAVEAEDEDGAGEGTGWWYAPDKPKKPTKLPRQR